MRLHRLQYENTLGHAGGWKLCPFELGMTNLLVGQNASGKSRTLQILHRLAEIITGSGGCGEGHWCIQLRDENTVMEYTLTSERQTVISEQLTIDGKVLLKREADGTGDIESLNGKLRFQVPATAVAVAAKRDLIQHPFLEPLHQWASSLRYYPFGTHMGQHAFLILVEQGTQADPKRWDQSAGLFRRGQREFGEEFSNLVCAHMNRLGYNLVDVRIEPIPQTFATIESDQPLPGPLQGLSVKERDLTGYTWQLEMSQGMFRALATLIHLAYAELAATPSCILIDDIGEGLDYERTTKLIHLLIEKSEQKAIQLILSTNDRFVMNAVPLKCWAVIRRTGSQCQVISHRNAPQVFEDFKLTGLNNFDFLQSKFFEQAELPSCPEGSV